MPRKRAEKLTPIPTPQKKAPRSSAARVQTSAPADLSHIIEGLRPLAVLVGDLQFDPTNARIHGDDNLDAIKGSLAVYGQRKPVVVNRRTGQVEAGNGTLQAALSLGWTHLAAVYVDDDPATAAGFAIADNRAAELADWDKDLLRKLLEDVNTGNDERLDQMVADLAEAEKLIPKDPDEPRSPADPEPETTASLQCPECGHVFTAGPSRPLSPGGGEA